MAEVTLTINGRNYGIACDDGQEDRVLDLGRYIDQRMKEISRAGAANNESHLMILTALMLADETFDLRDNAANLGEQVKNASSRERDESQVVQLIDQLAERIDHIAGRMKAA